MVARGGRADGPCARRLRSTTRRSSGACASSAPRRSSRRRTRLRDDEPGAMPPSALAAPLGSPPLAAARARGARGRPVRPRRPTARRGRGARRRTGARERLRHDRRSEKAAAPAASLAVALARCETLEEIGRAACRAHRRARPRGSALAVAAPRPGHEASSSTPSGVDAASIRRLGCIESIDLARVRHAGGGPARRAGRPPCSSTASPTPPRRASRSLPIAVDGVLLGSLVVTRIAGPRLPARRDHAARGHRRAGRARAARAALDRARRGRASSRRSSRS